MSPGLPFGPRTRRRIEADDKRAKPGEGEDGLKGPLLWHVYQGMHVVRLNVRVSN